MGEGEGCYWKEDRTNVTYHFEVLIELGIGLITLLCDGVNSAEEDVNDEEM
jgi:hypothetical protein